MRLHLAAGEVNSREFVGDKARGLATAVLGEAAQTGDPALMRSSAEMYAFAACIGSDAFAMQLVRSICTDMAQTSSVLGGVLLVSVFQMMT